MNLTGEQNLDTLLIGGGFVAIVLAIAFVRNRESARLLNRFGKDAIMLSALGVYYHGRKNEPGVPLRSVGALALTQEGLYYRARYLSRELWIPGARISSLSVASEFKGKNMYENIVLIHFVDEAGAHDSAGFKIPHPERWSSAIRTLFLDQN